MPLVSSLAVALLVGQAEPWVKPYLPVELPKTVAEFTDGLPDEGEGRLWVEGKVLKAIYRKKGVERVDLSGGVQEPMVRFAGTDYWGAQFKYDRWNEAIVAYLFLAHPRNPSDPFKIETWRGEDAPKLPEPVTELKGRMERREFETPLLASKRRVHVYLPPDAPTGIPLVVMADGQAAESYARIIEPLITSGKIRPIALIGIDSGPYQGDAAKPYQPDKDLRAREYLRQTSEETFDNHLKWVLNDVLPWARESFGLSSKREDTGVFGFSNGGSFAAAAAARFPDVFGLAFPFSAGVPPQDVRIAGQTSRYYFAAGSLESFSARTRQTYLMVKKWGAEAEYEEYEAGHDPTMWQIAFVDAAQKAFPPLSSVNQPR